MTRTMKDTRTEAREAGLRRTQVRSQRGEYRERRRITGIQPSMRNKERCREVANTKPCEIGIPVRLMDPEVYWGNPGNSEGSSFQPNNGKVEGKEMGRMGEPCNYRSLFLETRRVGLGLVRALCIKMEIGGYSAAPLYHRGNGYCRRKNDRLKLLIKNFSALVKKWQAGAKGSADAMTPAGIGDMAPFEHQDRATIQDLLSSIDEIVLSYVVSILEDLGSESSVEEAFDVEGFCEMMAAYFPEFSTIHHASVCQWMFELEASMSQKKRKELCISDWEACRNSQSTFGKCDSESLQDQNQASEWLERFKVRHTISSHKVVGESASVDPTPRLPSMCFPPLPAPKTQTTQPSPSMEPQPGPSTEPSSAPLTFTRPWDKETWQRLAPDCTYEEYIATDDDITVWGTLDNADIIREQQESSNGEGEEEMEEEPEDIPTTKDVLKAGDVYSRAVKGCPSSLM
uniref:Uncharacterized protein n=1 Tax=Timema bartmani TaxID=61472 RepID=A0A7R9EZ61_9NEOP|nr:unnamed protein product [Timema bartmani]